MVNYVETLFNLTLGERNQFSCLFKGCKSDKPLKNNANFIRHLVRIHSLGNISHFVARVFAHLNSYDLREEFVCNSSLEDVLISKIELFPQLQKELLNENYISQSQTQSSQIHKSLNFHKPYKFPKPLLFLKSLKLPKRKLVPRLISLK
jgi:hypothetical protein